MSINKSFLALLGAVALCGAAHAQPAPPLAVGEPFIPTRAQFEQFFPDRIPFYTYEGFVQAIRQTPGFAARGSEQFKRQEMAAFWGQIAHESDHLRALREYRQANWDKYCRLDPGESCAPGQQYYGRGPIQLSWNYQYKAAGDYLGLDLWANPDRVATDPAVAWRTALWYWVTQHGPAAQSSQAGLLAGLGFGSTTRAINGFIECDKPNDADAQRKVQRRAQFYKHASEMFGVPLLHPLGC